MRRAALSLAALLALAVPPRDARAESAAALLAAAAAQWDDNEYERAQELVDAALARADLTHAERIEALRLRGFLFVVFERPTEAEHVFAQIFALDPDYELPASTSPRFQAVFGPARARWQVAEQERLATELGPALAALRLRVELPGAPRGGRPLTIGVELVDPDAIADSLVLSHRRAGSSYYTTSTVAARPGRSALTIPAELTASRTPYTLELHVRARHRSGVTLRREGAVDAPLRLDVAAGEVPVAAPITRRWWFWAGLGVVAIGTGLLVREAVPVGPQPVVFRP